MRSVFGVRSSPPILVTLLCLLAAPSAAQTQQAETETESEVDESSLEGARIVTPEEVSDATSSAGTKTLGIIGWPWQQLMRGMNNGLVALDLRVSGTAQRPGHRVALPWSRRGIRVRSRHREGDSSRPGAQATDYLRNERIIGTRLSARMSPLSGYQEFSASFETSPFTGSSVIVHSDYQWRPFEQFYGFGQESRLADQSSFALRQWSAGALWETETARHFHFGSEYRAAILKAVPSSVGPSPSIDAVFGPSLPGLDQRTDLHSMGAFLDADFLQGDYGLGGYGHVSASWQDSFAGADLRYARYEMRLEGLFR